MMGVFVQVNEHTKKAQSYPVGYIIQESGCWDWVGGRSHGYGAFRDHGRRRQVRAHRWMYEQAKGPIPDGLQIDHLCRNPGCVNPDHLEAVTQKTNLLRGISPLANKARQTHCIHGHQFDEANTYRGTHGRDCRECARIRKRQYRLDRTRRP